MLSQIFDAVTLYGNNVEVDCVEFRFKRTPKISYNCHWHLVYGVKVNTATKEVTLRTKRADWNNPRNIIANKIKDSEIEILIESIKDQLNK